MVTSAIAKGKIAAIDTLDAERAPGVLLVLTHRNTPKQFGKPEKPSKDQEGKGEHAAPQLQGTEIKQYGQAVAFVVAETFEQATAAAALVRVRYDLAKGAFSLDAAKSSARPPRAPRMPTLATSPGRSLLPRSRSTSPTPRRTRRSR